MITACGGGSATPPVTPTITSFAATQATITVGSSTNLSAVFSGGSGVITPGNVSVTSGIPVSVSPATTTIYTLTVTPTSGSAISQTAMVTVVPAPAITGFSANPATITAGGSSSLTATFSGGTGIISPGNLTVTSGTPVSVNPAATTTYTLTVTNAAGTPVTQTNSVTVVAAPSISSFTANPTTIGAGDSSSLTAVFTGGTGVISPGNLSVTSGPPVNVSPATTTTYTLTVTNAAGTQVTQPVSVTVVPAPTITSFTANPTTIASGGRSSLTAVFSGGTGIISPGNLSVTSGTAQSVSPTTTTTYTLTVTPTAGTAVTQTVTVTVSAAPSITSFTASPTPITAGSSASLTATFSNGTGVITPGNLSVISGTPLSVGPTTTTTYTLTVSGAGGAQVQSTASVTVVPAPSITSFTANPTNIASGGSSALTGVFAGGTGVITPGNLAATSGTAVTVTPAAATTYTLTVTNSLGAKVNQTLSVTIQTSVTVDQSSSGPSVTDQILGMNMAAWSDPTLSYIVPALQTAGIKAMRWPGGSWSDNYHWNGNFTCTSASGNPPFTPTGWADPNAVYTKAISDLQIPGGLDVALTADYGTNAACTGPGDPAEAAGWVQAWEAHGGTVSHITVGNEEYGAWETDLHTLKNNAATYAAAVAGASGYYQLIKNVDTNVLVGVDVNPGNSPAWDPTVLASAPYDFVEFHYYPETPGQENDTFITHTAAQQLTSDINTIKTELATAGKSGTPIYVGEIGGPYSNPGRQSWSITQGLYAGQVLGEMMKNGVSRLTWWIGFGNCNGTGPSNDPANFSSSLYGWQDFGAYNVFSDGSSDSTCPGAGPGGTMSPTARAFQLFSNVAVDGENVLTATTAGDTSNVRAYAVTHSGGTALVLFNLSETATQPVTVTLSNQSNSTGVTVITYDKSIYDLSGSPTGVFPDPVGTSTWADPITTNLGAQNLPLTLTLTPWSMNVVIIQ